MTTDQIRTLIGMPAELNFVNVESTSFSCVDGRNTDATLGIYFDVKSINVCIVANRHDGWRRWRVYSRSACLSIFPWQSVYAGGCGINS